MALSNAAKSGIAIFVGAVQFGILMIVAEIIDSEATAPHVLGAGNETGYVYSVSSNYVSDLGANCRTSCYIPPSAYLFDASIALLGILIIVGAYFLHRAYKWMPATVMIALAGVGALGVGLFPETTGIWHHLFSLVVFLFAGLSAIFTYKFQKKPMGYFSVILGLATLIALVLYAGGVYMGLGAGGMERMIVYPTLLWALSFGGHMMASEDSQVPAMP
ncbi:MAG TPA: DUF998 domain-containing protein [Nitrososphaerales archaeon]|nr:DUF998 domain-containing protein [Nitrososphaerales archaeon]